MSYVHYNSEDNSIKVLRSNYKVKECFHVVESYDQFDVLAENGKFAGIEINNFLSSSEHKGRIAEDIYKKMLDENEIPCLYFSQSPFGTDFSETLKDKLQSKRADFLVNLPDVGTLFVDVKCRKRLKFPKSENTYFQISRLEVKQLVNLYSNILIPVWIAFYDDASIKNKEKKFYMIPISQLKKFVDGIDSILNIREQSMLDCIRIPQELLYKIENEISVKVGHYHIPDELLEKYASFHKGMTRRIEDEIKTVIRSSPILKSHVSDKLFTSVGHDYFHSQDVMHVLNILINEKTIVYTERKPLGLSGE